MRAFGPSSIARIAEHGQPAARYGVFAVVLLSCSLNRGFAETVLLRGTAQGTTYHIKLVVPAEKVDAAALQADIDRLLSKIDEQMSTYRDDSQVSRFNLAPPNDWFSVSPAVVEVVAAAQEISNKTSGAMDITVGPLVRLWHFGPQKSGHFKPPSHAELLAAHKRVGHALLDFRRQPPALKKSTGGLEIDLSSIASGYTIDQLTMLLTEHRITDFMVELGGEVRAHGQREDGKPWRVAIERPLVGKHEMEAAVPLENAAIATAGGTQKFFEFEGKRYSHIIDPKTGRPVEHTLASVTVVADTCLEADGWDTPLLVLGPQRGAACAERNGIAALFITVPVGADDAERVTTTSAWRKRLGNVAKALPLD